MRVLIAGCGYVGLSLGAELLKQGHDVWGMRRMHWLENEPAVAGIIPVIADVTLPETLARVPANYDWVVFCVSATAARVDAYREIYLHGLANVLEWLSAAPPQKLVYTSSTSVYGQTDGSVVDEFSPTRPAADTARVLLESEKALLEKTAQNGTPAIILRLAGIYGPGRGFWLRHYLQGDATIEAGDQRILNMIHREDAASAVIAAFQRGRPGEIYNVVDDEPVSQLTVFEWLAKRLARELPAAATPGFTGARKRGITNKRVSNRRLRAELACQLKYPSFREGFEEELRRLEL